MFTPKKKKLRTVSYNLTVVKQNGCSGLPRTLALAIAANRCTLAARMLFELLTKYLLTHPC